MEWLPKITLIVIVLAFIAIAFWDQRKSKKGSSESYYLADRKIGVLFNGLALAATYETLNVLMGIPASSYRGVLSTIAMGIGCMGGFLLLQTVAGPLRKFGSFTPIEFLTNRYGKQSALAGTIILLIMQIGYLTANLTGFGLILQWVFNFPYATGVIVGTVILLIITLIGGMWGVTHGAAVKCIIILCCYVVGIIGVAKAAGVNFWGIPWLSPDVGNFVAQKAAATPGWGIPKDGLQIVAFISMAFSFLAGTAGMPHMIMRVLTASSKKAAQRSVLILSLIFGFVFMTAVTAGMYGAMVFPQYNTGTLSDRLVLDLMGTAGPGVVALYLCAMMATILVTAGTIIMASSVVVINDVYKAWIKPNLKETNMITGGRIVALAIGVIGILMAVKPPAFMALIVAWAFGLGGSTLAVAYILGLFSEKVGQKAIITGMTVGALSYILMSLFKFPAFLAGSPPALFSVPFAFIAAYAVAMFTEGPNETVKAKVRLSLERDTLGM